MIEYGDELYLATFYDVLEEGGYTKIEERGRCFLGTVGHRLPTLDEIEGSAFEPCDLVRVTIEEILDPAEDEDDVYETTWGARHRLIGIADEWRWGDR